METILLIVVVAALVYAAITFFRSGGDFRPEFETLTKRTESTRNRIADALDRLEGRIRGKRNFEDHEPDSGESSMPHQS